MLQKKIASVPKIKFFFTCINCLFVQKVSTILFALYSWDLKRLFIKDNESDSTCLCQQLKV